LPYVFTRFTGTGVLDDASGEAMFTKGKPGVIEAGRMAGPHARQLPLNNEVVDFPN
jgi:hypothetical protein